MRHYIAFILAAAALNAAWAAAPQFNRVFGSHMVLPHGKNVPVSGTAEPNKEISVTFGGATLKTKADSKGNWTVTLPPMQPNAAGQTLTASQNGKTATLKDVLVGEVWLASGQSNMLFRLDQTPTGRQQDIAASADPELRIFNNVPRRTRREKHTRTRTLTLSQRTASTRGHGRSVPRNPPPPPPP